MHHFLEANRYFSFYIISTFGKIVGSTTLVGEATATSALSSGKVLLEKITEACAVEIELHSIARLSGTPLPAEVGAGWWCALEAGLQAAQVRTGKFMPTDAARTSPSVKVIDSVADLHN